MRGFLLLVGVLLCGEAALACSCMPQPECGPVGRSDVVFRGTVVSGGLSEWLKQAASVRLEREERLVRVRVEESFSGGVRVGEEVVIRTGWGGGDCGYPFQDGVTYLVDAMKNQGGLWTSICSGTGTERQKAELIQDLRTRAAGGRLNDVAGLLRPYAGTGTREVPNVALAGVEVTLMPVTGGRAIRTKMDANGSFMVPVVPAGRYVFATALPQNVALDRADRRRRGDEPIILEVPTDRGGAGCHFELFVRPSGSISGELVDARGGAEAIALMLTDEDLRMVAYLNVESGHFSARFLAAGTYYLKFFRGRDFEHAWLYPGVRSKDDAKPIVVRDGEQVSGIRMVVPVE